MRHDETGVIQFQLGVKVGNVAVIKLKLVAGRTSAGRSIIGERE